MVRSPRPGPPGRLARDAGRRPAGARDQPQVRVGTVRPRHVRFAGRQFRRRAGRFEPVYPGLPRRWRARLYRGALLYALHEGKLALADYEVALKDLRGNPPWNADQAALSIWTIRSMQARRSETDQDLRKHFKGRKPDLQRDWYGRVAAFLLEPADTEAALRREAESADGQRARLGGRRPLFITWPFAAAWPATNPARWNSSRRPQPPTPCTNCNGTRGELRVRLASGKISASQGSKAAAWRDNLPQPPKSRL